MTRRKKGSRSKQPRSSKNSPKSRQKRLHEIENLKSFKPQADYQLLRFSEDPEGSPNSKPLHDETPSWAARLAKYRPLPEVNGSLYALPSRLVVALSEEFERDRDPPIRLDFERELADLCAKQQSIGFFYGNPIFYEYLNEKPGAWLTSVASIYHDLIEQARHERKAASDRGEPLQKLSAEEQALLDRPPDILKAQLQESLATGEDRLQAISVRQKGFVGWLMTNSQFCEELDDLRNRFDGVVSKRRQHFMLGQPDLPDEAQKFLQRWCLNGLATWELPNSAPVQIPALPSKAQGDMSSMGVYAFIPFSFLAPTKLDVRDIITEQITNRAPEAIRRWVEGPSIRKKKIGHDLYAALFGFQHFWNILMSRYQTELRGKIGRLENAFAAFLCPGGSKKARLQSGLQTVKKYRKLISAGRRD